MSYPDIIVITGTSRGFGKELALHFLGKDVFVVGISRSKSNINHNKFREFLLDISNYEYTEYFLTGFFDLLESDKKIGVVLSAAKLGQNKGIINGYLSDFLDTYKTNVIGNLAVLRGILPYMLTSKFGRIVALAGGGSAYAYPEFTGYGLSKAAMVREIENLSRELEGRGDFSSVALAPGAMKTDMLAQVRASGGFVKTVVDISEPIDFVDKFMQLESKSSELNGRFVHSRDNYQQYLNGENYISDHNDKWKLRRIE